VFLNFLQKKLSVGSTNGGTFFRTSD